jgi:hypothetical protein
MLVLSVATTCGLADGGSVILRNVGIYAHANPHCVTNQGTKRGCVHHRESLGSQVRKKMRKEPCLLLQSEWQTHFGLFALNKNYISIVKL